MPPPDDGTRRPWLVVLGGGLGSARLALAVTEAGVAGDTTFVTNVADDWEVGALPVCPDTDAVLYALSGSFDEERGWGIRGDSFPGPGPGEPAWFGIGTADRQTHARRRALLDGGADLAAVIRAIARERGISADVVPVTCDAVRTDVRADGAWHTFQEWMVRDGGPPADGVRWNGLQRSRPSDGVIDAIAGADLVVLASSSPVASLAPVLGVAGIRDALERRTNPTLALSPVVLGRPVTTDRDRHRAQARERLMAATGMAHTPAAVARWLAPVVSHVAVDPSDAGWLGEVGATGASALVAPVIGIDASERRALVELFRELRSGAAAAAASGVRSR